MVTLSQESHHRLGCIVVKDDEGRKNRVTLKFSTENNVWVYAVR